MIQIKNAYQYLIYFGFILVFCLVLNPFVFLGRGTFIIESIIVAVAIFSLKLAIEFVFKKMWVDTKSELTLILPFALSPIIIGVISYFVFLSDSTNFFIYITTFVIIAFIPIITVFLNNLFVDLSNKIVLIGEQGSEINEGPLLKMSNDAGKSIFEVQLNKVICYEANDNYVLTYFFDSNDTISKSMERISLKKIENEVDALSSDFCRVHKSFLVNKGFITDINGKSQSYKLKLKSFHKEVPVSRNFDINQLN